MRKTQSREDYLKAIYQLGQEETPVATSALARRLGVGDGSVSGMLRNLSAKKLIRHEPYRGVSLTAAGERLALGLVRRHRLWEMFLVTYLGYAWDEIHDEAERLEHATSDEMTQRLDRLLGFPKTDPHGDPIPDRDGALRSGTPRPLDGFAAGDRVRIVRISDRNRSLLGRAARHHLLLNTVVTIRKADPAAGTMTIVAHGKTLLLDRDFARAFSVEPL